jgi:hypothetical protein
MPPGCGKQLNNTPLYSRDKNPVSYTSNDTIFTLTSLSIYIPQTQHVHVLADDGGERGLQHGVIAHDLPSSEGGS